MSEKKESASPVTRITGTCAYLSDGTKIVIRRDPKDPMRVWLEHVPQAVLRTW